MPLPGLLFYPQDPHGSAFFAHEHKFEHRKLHQALDPTLTFSVSPYVNDPIFEDNPKWHLNHAQSHYDALTSLPSYFGAVTATGVFTTQNLVDTDLTNEPMRTWWTFENHTEHRLASATMPKP